MSKLSTLITALVLGTSSMAAADPSFSFHASTSWSTSSSPTVRDHRLVTEGRFDRHARFTWLALSEPMQAGRRNVIRVAEDRDVLSALRLQLSSGMTYIYDVEVRFEDGSRQTLSVNKWLWSNESSMQLALNRRAGVDMILVKSWGGRPGSFQVFGQARQMTTEQPQPPIYQPPVYQPPVYQPPVHSYVAGKDLTFANTLGYKYVALGADKGRFGSMRIQATSGAIHITYMEIHYTSGAIQVLQPHRTIQAGSVYDFKLDGNGANAITQIVLKTNDTGTAVTDPSTFNLVLF